jgi:hypothetical protein
MGSHPVSWSDRVAAVTEQLKLSTMRYPKELYFEHLLTSDESWFYYEYPYDSAWASSKATLPTRKHIKFRSKSPVSIIWSTSNIHSVPALPAGRRYDAKFLCASILPDIERNLCDGRRKKTLRGVYFHSIMRQVTMPNGRGKRLPAPKSPGSCIQLIFLMLHPVTSSCLAP